mgnify:FL=1
MVIGNHHQRGGAIYFLFVAIALFGAVSWAMLQSSRTSTGIINGETDKAAATAAADCANAAALAEKRLQLRGCTAVSYYIGDTTSPDAQGGACSIFHPEGGGVAPCNGLGTALPCQYRLGELAIGESCAGMIYAASFAGDRLFVTAADAPAKMRFGTITLTPALSLSDGPANTDALLSFGSGGPYQAAVYCRSLGPKWYLPSVQELLAIRLNRNVGAMAGTFTAARYGTSTDSGWAQRARAVDMADTATTPFNSDDFKTDLKPIRCVRRQ